MPQFDVHLIAGEGLVVDCQSALLSDLPSRVVAPLRDPDDVFVTHSKITPEVVVNGKPLRVAAHLLRAVERRRLGEPIASVCDQEWAIKNALDMVLTGF